jgi:unsaturated rhamnogalacturonyl hydrolase
MTARLALTTILWMTLAPAQPVDGVTHLAIRVNHLDRSRAFYSKLGFQQAFDLRDHGRTTVAFIKINDRQFIELWPRSAAGQPAGFFHICFDSPNVAALRAEYAARGLAPGDISTARAGNLLFTLRPPEGDPLEFLEYRPGSLHWEDRGKHLGPRRVSARLESVTIPARDPGRYAAFLTSLALDAAAGVRAGSSPRLTFRVDDLKRATAILRARGLKFPLTDPDGVAIELVESPWTDVADRLISTPVESYPFNWGEGVQMMGLMRAAASTGNPRYTDYVENWARIWEARNRETLLNIGETISPLTRRGYCGHWSPASAILYLYSLRRDAAHLKLARDVAGFIRSGAERSPEGALGHWQGSHQLWVDTLFMACPLLAGLGRLDKRPEYIDDAAGQIILHARHLQHAQTGLFFHMWDWQTGRLSEGFWGRGNGWVLMSIADTIEVMRRNHPRYGELAAIAARLAKGIQSTQNAAGLWHTILDDPRSYEEASATAMFTYGLLKLSRLGVLPRSLNSTALRGWNGINERFVKDGQVLGVSAGTDPRGRDAYRTIALGRQTWGTGAFLLAATEVARILP